MVLYDNRWVTRLGQNYNGWVSKYGLTYAKVKLYGLIKNSWLEEIICGDKPNG